MPKSHLKSSPPKLVIGWREWLALPEFGIEQIKAKVDTGARSSALHAFDVRRFTEDGKDRVAFRTRPRQRNDGPGHLCKADLFDVRPVRSSNGALEVRFFIRTEVELMGQRWPIELTLARRDEMSFRMLLGREALRGRFLVDPGRSFADPAHMLPTRRSHQ